MNHVVDRQKTLDQLDPPAWGEPRYSSYLVTTCHQLRRKPIGEFTVEDLRIMIGQGFALPWLVPLALEVLEPEPLAEGDFYPGDLLVNVLRVPPAFWVEERALFTRVSALLENLSELPREVKEAAVTFRGLKGQ